MRLNRRSAAARNSASLPATSCATTLEVAGTDKQTKTKIFERLRGLARRHSNSTEQNRFSDGKENVAVRARKNQERLAKAPQRRGNIRQPAKLTNSTLSKYAVTSIH